MTYDDYTAGVDLWRATGSLIARPQVIVPVIILPEIRLWLPWERQDDYPAGIWMMNDEHLAPDVGQTWRNEPGIAPPLTMDAVRQTVNNLHREHPPGWFDVMGRVTARVDAMFAEALRGWGGGEDPPDFVPDEDLVATLLDFARAGDEPAFRDLALMRGVPAGEIETMWQGTLKRVGKGK